MSLNTGTLFEAAGTAEVTGHYTRARSLARTFCDTAAAPAAAAPRASPRAQTKCLNQRAESAPPHGVIRRRPPDWLRRAPGRAARLAGRDSRQCLVLSKQVIANQGVFMSARTRPEWPKECALRPKRVAFPRGGVFEPHVTFAQQAHDNARAVRADRIAPIEPFCACAA
jgi:hypothetical protein